MSEPKKNSARTNRAILDQKIISGNYKILQLIQKTILHEVKAITRLYKLYLIALES